MCVLPALPKVSLPCQPPAMGKSATFRSKVVSVRSIAFVDSYEGVKVISEPC